MTATRPSRAPARAGTPSTDGRRDVPAGWTRPVACAGCGPVLLWPDAPDAVIGCPWCHHRKTGRNIPRPATFEKQSKQSKQT
jgi:hypothetical protein